MVGENRGSRGKTYADYLRQGTKVNKAYIMPKGARPPQRKSVFGGFEDEPVTPSYKSKTIEQHIKLAEYRERMLNKDIRREVLREIQRDSGLAET